MSDRHFTLEELSAYLDGELDLDEKQQAHLKGCPECTKVFEGQRLLRRLARDAAPHIPTDAMWSVIKGRIGEHMKEQMAEAGGRKHDAKRTRAGRAKPKNGGFRWGPGLWLGLSSALAAAGVILVIRPAVEESHESMPPAPAPVAYAPEHMEEAKAPREDVARKQDAPASGHHPAPARKPSKKSSQATGTRNLAKATRTAEGGGAAGAASQPAATRSDEPRAAADESVQVASAPAPAEPEMAPSERRATKSRAAAPAAAPADRQLVAPEMAAGLRKPSAPKRATKEANESPVTYQIVVENSGRATVTQVLLENDAPDVIRQTFRTKAFILIADRINMSDPAMIRASGRVFVQPAEPRSTYTATIDGVTRTVTGDVTGALAEIENPGQKLILHTKPAVRTTK